jgi:hypothetical protein
MRAVWGWAALLSAITAPFGAQAQDVNGVPNPDINLGRSSISFRMAFQPGSGGKPYSYAHQVAYQRAFSDSWSMRLSVQHGTRGGSDFGFRFLQGDVQYQFAEDQEYGWDGSVLLVLRVPDGGDGPGRIGTALAAKYAPDIHWEMRGVIFAGREFGLGSRDGITLATRVEATRDIAAKLRLGAQLVDNFNTTAHFGSFDEQSHQAGLVAKGFITDALSYNAGALFGVSDAAPDTELRLFFFYDL